MKNHGKWVGGWSCCENILPQTMGNLFMDTTHRYLIFAGVDGEKVRLRYSNLRGETPVTIDEVFVARALDLKSTAVEENTVTPVTFGGKKSLTLAPGELAISDEVPLSFAAGAILSISQYFRGVTELRAGHAMSGEYVSMFYTRGNFAASADLPPETTGALPAYLFLCGVDFYASAGTEAIVAFGDSITQQPWPDCLARRLFESGVTDRTVLRKGIGGGKVLRAYDTYRPKMHYGVSGVERFRRDITQPGVTKVIVLHGINDIIHPGADNPFCPLSDFPSFDEMIGGYRTYIEAAHSIGAKIYFATLLPCGRPCMTDGSRPRMELLHRLNDWILTCGEHDGAIDFNAAVRSPEDPDRMPREYTKDSLHPTLAGARVMAGAIPMEFLR